MCLQVNNKHMALQINTTLENGVIAEECYAKILNVNYQERPLRYGPSGIQIGVGFYFNKAARDDDINNTIIINDYVIEDRSIEAREDQYSYLKTLDDFSGAIDV